jgi:AGCS family alanine or glycine:cation symporter
VNSAVRRSALVTILALLATLFPLASAWPSEITLDERINNAVGPFTNAFADIVFTAVPVNGVDFPLIVMWLITAGILMTFYNRFVNLRCIPLALRIVRGDYDDPDDRGEVTHFQALSAALSATVGLGNIAGVAVAIGLGGPGATFWMIIAGLFSMTTKFVECTLATKYRKIREDGVVSGGPMYYLKYGLAEKGFPRLGAALGAIFAVFCVFGSFGGGNMFQVNQAFQQFEAITGGTDSFFHGRGWLFGLIMAVMVGMVIIGGIRSIAKVTAKLVPFMCAIYVTAAIIILIGHADQIPAAFGAIIDGAFSPEGVGGGIVGVLIQGIRRAAFSNEAGIGSAPIAHAAVKTNEPVTEGLVALLEPFIDTVIICTMTALVIVITGMYKQPDLDGISMTSAAFGDVITWFPVLLSIAVVLFAFSTQITWSYYGLKAWTYLLGDSRSSELTYKLIFCTFTVIGATFGLGAVVNFSDAAMFAMSLPNLIGVYMLAPVARRELNSFLERIKQGKVAISTSA